MKAGSPDQYSSNLLRKYIFALAGWSVLVAGSLAWNIYQEDQETLGNATATARANINKDIGFRKWVASHGGVYVAPSERTPPNPYLNVPDRDVVTTTGKALTLMNPAYALREMQNSFGDEYGSRSHITSLKPLNPLNAADAWETGAMMRLERGSKEVMEVMQIEGQPHLRVMRPFVVEQDCLKCHAHQGYKLGDIHGGIGTDVSLAVYLAEERKLNTSLSLSHGLIWLIGLLGGNIFYRRERCWGNERSQAETDLRESEGRFRAIADAAPILIWMSGTDKLCNFFNQGWLQFTGRSMEQEAGNGWSEGVHPDDLKDCFDAYVNAFDAHRKFCMEYRLRRHDGEYRWLEDCGVPRFDNAGRFIGYIGNCVDITERKQAEEGMARYARNMRERVKEISCLRDITVLSLKKSLSIENVLDSCARRIPGGWLEPQRTCARIRLNDQIFETSNFHETEWKLAAAIPFSTENSGVVEVFYSGDGSKINENPFLGEEHDLISSIAVQLGLSLERRWAEEKLLKSEERLKLATRAGGIGVWDYDPVHNILVWDDSMFVLYGAGREEFSGAYDAWQAFLHPGDRSRGDKEVQEALQGIKPFDTEFRIVQPNGNIRQIKALGDVIRDEHGNPIRIVGANWDITERKQMETALVEIAAKAKRFADALDSIGSSYVYMKDLKHQYFYANKTTLKLFNCSAEELAGSGDAKFFPPETVARLKAVDDRVLEHGETTMEEIDVSTDSPERRVYLEVKTPIYDDAGKIIGLCGISTDITERKKIEEALQKSENLFRNYFELGQVGMAITSLDQKWLKVNSRLCEMLGYSKEELTGMTWVELTHPDDLEADIVQFRRLLSGKVERYSMDKRFIHKDGSVIYTYLTVTCQRKPDNSVEYVIASVADITDRKEHEEELKRSNAELEQFSYAVSHDMRQPLRMISSYLQLIEMSLSDQLDGEKRDYFNFAIDGAKRIDQMLVALLEYSRVGRMGEPSKWIESRAVLDEALQFLQPVLTEAQAKLDITGSWPHIFASHDEMLRLIQNLIGNAAKYRIAERKPEITVSGETVKNEWRMCVADNGVGIIPGQIKRLFRVFQRLHSHDAYEGTGIGLALCRKIAEHHKGRIWAESSGEGQGSKFCVALPVLREETKPAEGRAA